MPRTCTSVYDNNGAFSGRGICCFIIGIKHDFPFINNIRKVPREMLKTSDFARYCIMNDKIMFDCYYGIN